MATRAIQIHHAPHPRPFMDLSVLEDYCDDFVPYSHLEPNEDISSIDTEPSTKENKIERRVKRVFTELSPI